MDNIENRAVIKYLYKKGLPPKKIFTDMKETLGDTAPSYSCVKQWTGEFKRGRELLTDDPRAGRKKTATNDEIIRKIASMIENDQRLKIREIADCVCRSHGSVQKILCKELKVKKIFSKWISCSLSETEKRSRLEFAKESVALYEADSDDFFAKYITMDETWLSNFLTDSQIGTKENKKHVKLYIIWNIDGVVLFEQFTQEEISSDTHQRILIDKLEKAIEVKRSLKCAEPFIFHYNCKLFDSLKCRKMKQPPKSPDLYPSDYFLFPRLKQQIINNKLSKYCDILAFILEELENRDNYKTAVKEFLKRCKMCIELQGDYVLADPCLFE